MNINKQSRLKAALLIPVLIILAAPTLLIAPTYAESASIAQGYTTKDKELEVGMAAGLNSAANSSGNEVIKSTISNIGRFVGIVTTKDANLVTLTSSSASLVVTTAGQANALVADINGLVKKGDYLTISPLNGILMKADVGETSIIGSALADFSKDNAAKQQATDSKGAKHDVYIAFTLVEVKARSSGVAQNNTSFLVAVGKSITGKPVSAWRVLLAFAIFIALLVLEGTLVRTSIRTTISSLGRNPLAKNALYRQLFQVLLAVLFVLAFGLATIYAILRI